MKEKKSANNLVKYILILLFIGAILTWQAVFYKTDHYLHINMLNVGQGDAIHIRKDNIDLLFDGGPDGSVLTELGKTMPFYDRELEYVFLTHADSDHVTGLVDVIKNYQVDHLYLTGAVKDTAVFNEFISTVESENIQISFIRFHDEIDIGDDFDFQVFWPDEEYAVNKNNDINNTSIVGRLSYKDVSILLTGDVENDAQTDIVSTYGGELSSDILKVAHHGSKNATSESLLSVVEPEIALISVGEGNSFGHPHKETLDLLEKFGVQTFRTDCDSTISIISDGINFWKE